MAQGTVKTIHSERGFGFIRQPKGADLFFHFRELRGLEFDETLIELSVQFDIIPGPDGRTRAANVRRADF